MVTLEENIVQAISDFDDIEAAIKEQGIDVPKGTDTKEYGKLVRSLANGYDRGYDDGYTQGTTDGYTEGKTDGYADGYEQGKADASADSQWDGYWLKTATQFTLPNGTDRIQQYAFMNFESLESVEMPTGITFIGEYAFYNCKNLVLTELPKNLAGNIGSCMFYGCEKLALTELPSGITGTIGSMAFRGCIGLKSLTFKGTPKSISANVFQNCTNLITINVPWAEGAVANAPWGATNATINYNYAGE